MRSMLAMLLLVACGDPRVPLPPPPIVPIGGGGEPVLAGERLESANRIDDAATWSRLRARPPSQVVARTEVVKFLIDFADERRIWFIDTERWSIHYYFARDRLSTPERLVEEHDEFNTREYRMPDRRFVMGSLVHYLDSDLWTFEMIAGDNLEGARIAEVFEHVRESVYFGSALRYRPISVLHEQMISTVRDRLPIATADEVFAGIRYQPLTQGVAFGTLRFVRGELDAASVRPDQILVLEHLPDQIPVSSAVISAPLQAPLGHLAILTSTRNTPNMALRGALEDERLRALDGRVVRLEVGAQEFTVREVTLADAEAAWASRRPAQALTPTVDRSDVGFPDVCSLRLADVRTVGAKTAQLGEACSIGPPIVTPGGFAVPFIHYLQHIERASIAASIPQMLADQAFRTQNEVRGQRLAELRAAIERAPVDPALLRAVRSRIARFPRRPRVILRSSTNAEDLPGFTGAGLYRSIVVSAGASEREIADAIRQVFSSVWLQAAYEEREWYRVVHADVAMAILVQPFVDGAIANGVAITANPFYANRPGYFVNAQALGGSVTGAQGDEIPEQHLIYTWMQPFETELLTRSSRTGGALLLGDREIRELADVLTALHTHLSPIWIRRANALDVEFLIAGPDRHVVVLQARPFHVVYPAGRGERD